MGFLAVLYWVWLFGAVAVLAYRVYRRATGQRRRVFEFRSNPETDADGDTASSAPEAIDALAATAPHPPAPAATAAPAPPPPPRPTAAPPTEATTPPVDTPAAADGLDAGEIHPSVLAAMRDDEPHPDPTPAPDRGTGLFSAESRRSHQEVAVGTLAPLRETLTGISMPCDLVPVTDLGPRPTREQHRERLVLMTTEAGAGEVAARLADELERIGLDVTSTGTASCVARRHDRAVEVRVHEFPDRVTSDGAASFPTVPDGGVVVELLAA